MTTGRDHVVPAPETTTTTTSLDATLLRTMYEKMLLTRQLDLRAWSLSRQGKAHFVITGRGHEAAQVGSALAVRAGYDWVVPYYRDLGVAVALGITARQVMLNVLGRADDPYAGGRQLSMHFSHRELRIVSGSSVVATHIPHAVGIALASKLRGDDVVTIVYLGEGATSKGDFHEAINWAGVEQLPIVFFCENNGYAISLPQRKQMPIRDVADRAAGYGMPGVIVDGMDPVAVYEVTAEAIARARRGEGPTLIEAKVYRLTPHSSDDDDRFYRSRDEVAEWEERDPIPRMRTRLLQAGVIAEDEDTALQQRIVAEVDEAVDFAEASPHPDVADAMTHVYAEG